MKNRTVFLFLLALILASCSGKKANYTYNKGVAYGTTYSIVYESPDGEDFLRDIEELFQSYTLIFSPYEPASTISKVNRNEKVQLEQEFIDCFEKAQTISERTNGAFDVTAGSLVNAWGFGPEKRKIVTDAMVDSLMRITGYKKVNILKKEFHKTTPGIKIDMNAISKGYTCDLMADFLEKKGCRNYMVEIGGEVAAKGVNSKGKTWVVGIRKPDENPFQTEIEAKLRLDNKAMATSGNYLNFYELDGKKYAHTIDPTTGYPVQHSLLSATVVANDCITADAYATAFMVLGKDLGIEIARQTPELQVYFIYADDQGTNKIYMSDGFGEFLVE